MTEKRTCSSDRNIRQSLGYVLKNDGPFRWGQIVGFSKQEFLEHIKKEFSDGMTVDNYGEWVISFHIPKRCYRFVSINDNDFKKFWSLKNITPRWLRDAQRQKKKIDMEEVRKFNLFDILPDGNLVPLLKGEEIV